MHRIQGFPNHLWAPNILNSITLDHQSVSNTDWQMCQESSRSQAQLNTTWTGTWQQEGTKALLLWVPLLPTVNTLHGPALGYSTGLVTKLPLCCQQSVPEFSLNTKGVELQNKAKYALWRKSLIYSAAHCKVTISLLLQEKREAPALSGKATWHRKRKCKYPKQNFHQINPTIIYTNSVDEWRLNSEISNDSHQRIKQN